MTTTKLPTKSRKNGVQRLFDKAGAAVAVRVQRSTVTARKAELLKDLGELNATRLGELKEKMAGFIDLITLSFGEAELLTEDQAELLMTQFLARRDVSEFMDVCQMLIKETVFNSLDAEFAAQGEDEPSLVNGCIEVPALGKKFCREAAGPGDPKVDEDLLRQALGAQWTEVYVETVIPETRVQTLDMDKLMALVDSDPAVMEKIRDALVPGQPKPGRLFVRDL